MNYLVTLDQKLAVIENNRAKVPKDQHGVIVGCEEPYNYRSRHPFIVAWVVEDIEALNQARYALVCVTSVPMPTQLVNDRLGHVFTVEATYDQLTKEEISQMHATPITLSELLAKAPRLHVEPKRFPVVVALRLTTPQTELLNLVGGGNITEGARTLIEHAIETKPTFSDLKIPKQKLHSVTLRVTEEQAQFLNDAGSGHPSKGAHLLFQWAIANPDQSLRNLRSDTEKESL